MSFTSIPVNPLRLLRYISSMHKVATLQEKRRKSKEKREGKKKKKERMQNYFRLKMVKLFLKGSYRKEVKRIWELGQ